MSVGFVATMVTLNLLNLLLHSVGTYLLVTLYKSGNESIHMVNLINLSITEIIASFAVLSDEGPELIYEAFHYHDGIQTAFTYWSDHTHGFINIIIYTIFCVYYMTMIYVTVDRLMEVLLNIRYPVFWNELKAKYLVIATWSAAVVMCTAVSLAYQFSGFEYEIFFNEYVFLFFNIAFSGLFILTYTYLSYKYTHAQIVVPSQNQHGGGSYAQNVWLVLRRSRFFVSLLLVITFVSFMVAPNLFANVYSVFHGGSTHVLTDASKLSTQLSFLTDAVIYVFIQPKVRRLLWRKVSGATTYCNNILKHNGHSDIRTFGLSDERDNADQPTLQLNDNANGFATTMNL